jgi:hypothetical protein
MGPDELATREELGLIVKYLFAKLQQQAEMISTLAGMAATSGGITKDQFNALIAQTEHSQNTARSKEAKAKLVSLQPFAISLDGILTVQKNSCKPLHSILGHVAQ